MKRGKKRPIIKRLLLFFFTLVMLSGVGMIYLDFIYNQMYKNSNVGELVSDDDRYSKIVKNNFDVLNVLVVGLDEPEEKYRGRSDATMILSIDDRHKKIKITSLMRDLWIPIPGYGEGKLNWAYPKGGMPTLYKVIYSHFGIKIDKYAMVDFKKFENVIDQIGGIDLSLTTQEVNFVNKYSDSREKLVGSGLMHLNGNQALQFARDRDDPSGDFKRTERQRIVISAIINQMKNKVVNQKIGMIELMSLANNVMKSVKHDFSAGDVILLTKQIKKFINYQVVMCRIPVNCKIGVKNGHSVMLADLNECKKDLLNFVYENG